MALTPTAAGSLAAHGVAVVVEAGAGLFAGHADGAYTAAGARVVHSGQQAWNVDVVVRVGQPAPADIERLPRGGAIVGFLAPFSSADVLRALRERRATALAFEALPRVTAAQAMDALSSQSTAAGYAAALEAATASPKFFPMLTTAAGTVAPAKVLVLGAGVAGLQAVATARRLGAVTAGYDVRPEAAEQIESLGATAVRLDIEVEPGKAYARELAEDQRTRLHELLTPYVADADVVITTAAVPGRPAPILITQRMVHRMRPGAVIVDAAMEAGGNCEVSRAGERRVHGSGVIVCGPTDLPSRIAADASQMYANNVLALLQRVIVDGELVIDPDDDIVSGACVVHRGEMRHELACRLLSASGSHREGGVPTDPRTVTAEEVAVALARADRVLIVPGYGLAVARAQHDAHTLARKLEARGVDVRYVIHPVAGRMPGHMDVLLAEAGVPYDRLLDLEAANERVAPTDVVLVLGANDVINPSARDDPDSPLSGMPVVEVDGAGLVVVVKRSLAPGHAGVDNPLFHAGTTAMLFGDAAQSLQSVTDALSLV